MSAYELLHLPMPISYDTFMPQFQHDTIRRALCIFRFSYAYAYDETTYHVYDHVGNVLCTGDMKALYSYCLGLTQALYHCQYYDVIPQYNHNPMSAQHSTAQKGN
jgi:hypothetical protein